MIQMVEIEKKVPIHLGLMGFLYEKIVDEKSQFHEFSSNRYLILEISVSCDLLFLRISNDFSKVCQYGILLSFSSNLGDWQFCLNKSLVEIQLNPRFLYSVLT